MQCISYLSIANCNLRRQGTQKLKLQVDNFLIDSQKKSGYFFWGIVDVQYYVSLRCTTQWFTIVKGYIQFIVIIKYQLYFLCCTIQPHSLFLTLDL